MGSGRYLAFATLLISTLFCCQFSLIQPAYHPSPADATQDSTRVELGRMLFYDPILSADSSISCSSCHKQQFAFSDTVRFNTGIQHTRLLKNTMSLVNLDKYPFYFWDGRVHDLMTQITSPINAKDEMGANLRNIALRLNQRKDYLSLFVQVYGQQADSGLIIKSIYSFIIKIKSYDSPVDRLLQDIAKGSPKQGYQIKEEFQKQYTTRERDLLNLCESCHSDREYGGIKMKNNGLKYPGNGLYSSTHITSDKGKFKAPTLRNIALTPPYMHDGRFKTLEDVLDHYDHGIEYSDNLDSILKNNGKALRLSLSPSEKKMLLKFLISLTDTSLINNPNYSNPWIAKK